MSYADVTAYVSGILVLVGSIFSLVAAIGMLRFPDVYTRLHAAAKAGPVGAGSVLIAVAVSALNPTVAVRALAGTAFLILTSPIAAHLLARAAYLRGVPLDSLTKINEIENETLASEE